MPLKMRQCIDRGGHLMSHNLWDQNVRNVSSLENFNIKNFSNLIKIKHQLRTKQCLLIPQLNRLNEISILRKKKTF